MIKITILIDEKESDGLNNQDPDFIEWWIRELLYKGPYPDKGEGLSKNAIKSVIVDEIKDVVKMSETVKVDFSQLKWFSDSPDAGDPACLCSLCEKIISEDEVPIRMWSQGKVRREIRLHWDCFLKVKK